MSEPATAAPEAESTATVLVAAAVNLAIAAAKAIGAALSGSAAMFSEAAHSVADTVTEVLLLVAVRRGARPSDRHHPFGHGREFYLWALMAAVSLFVAGAGVSISEGIDKVLHGEHEGDSRVAFAVLGIAFVLESLSLARAVRQLREGARRWGVTGRSFLRLTTDTAVKAVTFEDTAALVGLTLAAVGLGLSEVTGNGVWDGVASILIGLLLLVVAVTLARVNSRLLIGRSATPELERRMLQELRSLPFVVDVPLLVTTVLGPERLLVAARVEFAADRTADEVADIADEAERRFLAVHPGVREVFIDPTRRRSPAIQAEGFPDQTG